MHTEIAPPPPSSCSCCWEAAFEGEILGDQYYLTGYDRRCKVHGKPRWKDLGKPLDTPPQNVHTCT